MEKSEFESTKQCYGIEDTCQAIQEKLNIDWRAVAWTDLTKPLYSGLAASLRLQQIAGNSTPGVLERQADFWVDNYHKGQSPFYFISEVKQIYESKVYCTIELLQKKYVLLYLISTKYSIFSLFQMTSVKLI